MCSNSFHTHWMTCIVRQWVLQVFVILCTVLRIESTIELQRTKKISDYTIKTCNLICPRNNTLPAFVWPREPTCQAIICEFVVFLMSPIIIFPVTRYHPCFKLISPIHETLQEEENSAKPGGIPSNQLPCNLLSHHSMKPEKIERGECTCKKHM